MKNINTIASLFFCAVVAFIIIRSCDNEDVVSHTEINEKIDTAETEQYFTAEEVNRIIAFSIDSVEQRYKNNPIIKFKLEKFNIDSLRAVIDSTWKEKLNVADLGAQIFETTIDTLFTAIDTTGRITDRIKVTSSYYSRLPPDPSAFMTTKLVHKNYDYVKTITVKETVIKKPVFTSGIFGGPGYGLINKKFDVFIGYGLTLEFDLIKIIGGI